MKNITPPVIPNAVRDLTNSRSHGARKNRSIKTILVFLALGLISCAFCVQQAQAVPPDVITFAGGAELGDVNGVPVNSVNNATQVIGWLDEMGNGPTVESVSGVFATFAMVGHTVTFANNWSFESGPIAMFWQVDGFTFDLVVSHILFQGDGFLAVFGTGLITGHGYTSSGTWRFSTQDDPANGVFSFSASTVPDGGATAALLGLGLVAIEGLRRKLRSSKS